MLFDAPPAQSLPVVKPPAPSDGVRVRRATTRSAISAFSTTGRNICCSSTPASEKWEVAQRVGLELANIHPRPPAVRVFDAGVGDGSVLARVMRSMHDKFPTMPHYIVGKEISLEDVRLSLHKMADRFVEHPSTVLVLTNLAYAEAPWLAAKSLRAATSMVWKELAMDGSTAHYVRRADHRARAVSGRNWKAKASARKAATRSMSGRSCW